MPPLDLQDRRVSPDHPALADVRALLEFLLSLGADEFSMRFQYAGEDAKVECDRLHAILAEFSRGEALRECTVTYAGERNPPIEIWRLDARSIGALSELLPSGVLVRRPLARAWPEDLCVYRGGQLVFGSVTHERFAFLRLGEAEWQRWMARAT